MPAVTMRVHDRHMHSLVAISLALVLGCTSAGPHDAADRPATSSTSTSSPTRPASSASVAGASGIQSTVTSVDDTELDGAVVELTYEDVVGRPRTIRAELRLPTTTSNRALPVVVWSHGGSQGFRRTGHVGDRWGRAMTEAGMAFVAIAHVGRTEAQRAAMCTAVGAADCSVFNPLLWDRPHDVAVVLDWIDSAAVDLGLDPSRVIHGGHSAGAIGVLSVAGMSWTLDTELAPPADARPIGFLAASPPGTEARGITADDLDTVDRPVLFLTGLGDETSSTRATDRRATFSLLPADAEAVMLWIDRPEARHGLFDLNLAPCERAGGAASACRTGARVVARTGVDFVRTLVADPSGFDAMTFVDDRAAQFPAAVTLTSER